MSGPQDARGPQAVARFLRPRSVAIIGISTREGSAGQIILQCLKVNNFKGDIHLVGRTDAPIDGRPVLKSPDELPEGVELAVFTLPAAAVREAIESCARRKVRSAMVFAAGFAEVGDRATQDAVIVQVPAERPPRIGEQPQDGLLLIGDAVLAAELAQLLVPDPALAGLDPAHLRRVAFQDPGHVVQRVAPALSVAAQGLAYQASSYGGRDNSHDEPSFALVPFL